MSDDIPINALRKAEGHIVTIVTMVGETYTGKLLESNVSVQMEMCTVIYSNGHIANFKKVLFLASKIRFIIFPDWLKGELKISLNEYITSSKPSSQPAQNKISQVIFIQNLTQPFTVNQLRKLLHRTGRLTENGFWINSTKSKCYAMYENEDQAEETRMALHGVKWPVSNPKTLKIEFATESDLKKALMESASIPPKTFEDWRDEIWRKKCQVGEWDLAKMRERSPGEYERKGDYLKKIKKDQFKSRSHSKSPQRKGAKNQEDYLLRKDKTPPAISWLPLTTEQDDIEMALKESITTSKSYIQPAQNKISQVIFIQNLTQPFTINQLRKLLQVTGRLTENGFWLNSTKSKCYAMYENEDQAEETRMALHGEKWPMSNPKTLSVDFATEGDLKMALKESAPPPPKAFEFWRDERWRKKSQVCEWDLAKIRECSPEEYVRKGDYIHVKRKKEQFKSRSHSKSLQRKGAKKQEDYLLRKNKATPAIEYWRDERCRREGLVRERDFAKIGEHSPGEYVRKQNHLHKKRKKERFKDRSHSKSPQRKGAKKQEDYLLRKDKTPPAISWLPLTPEQIAEKEEKYRQKIKEQKLESLYAEFKERYRKEQKEREIIKEECEKKREELEMNAHKSRSYSHSSKSSSCGGSPRPPAR